MTLILQILATIWSNPWGRTLLIGSGLFLFGLAKGWSLASVGKDAAINKAITRCNAEWQQTLAKADQEHEADLAKAIEEANAIVTNPNGGRADIIRMCGDKSTAEDCREGELYRMQGVPKAKVQH
jgi:hypothetical protein